MNKEQFVAAMHKKLHVIEEHERQDIIDEYIKNNFSANSSFHIL
mgnify:CR=1 FL=1